MANRKEQKKSDNLMGWRRLITWLMTVVFIVASIPGQIIFAATPAEKTKVIPASQKTHVVPPPDAPKVKVRKGPRTVTIITPKLQFSKSPTEIEITSARIFPEPLAPMSGKPIAGENQVLAKALVSFKAKKDLENVSDLTHFISSYPNSRWRPALELNLGLRRLETGYLTAALTYFKSAWERVKTEKGQAQKAVADRAIAELLHLDARLGRTDELEKYLTQIEGRIIQGSVEEKIREAREGLWMMQNRPDVAFKCGPFAVNTLIYLNQKTQGRSPVIDKAVSTKKGTNLAQVKQWADQVGLKYQLAKRSKGAPFITPAVMHWKVGHFAAMTAYKQGRYQVQDPTFGSGGNLWITAKALEAETDGYFLVPIGPLPPGWKSITRQEAQNVWGKGNAENRDEGKGPGDPQQCMGANCGDCDGGMAQASAFTMQATLKIMDTPLGYSPPVGPMMNFLTNYNHLEINQPATFTFPNLGPAWSLNWVSYLTVDASRNATVRVRGGGVEVYKYTQPDNVSNPYPPYLTSQALLTITGVNSYQRQLPDGSIEIFNQPDGSGRIFMTQVIDPQGNAALIQYDANFRITSITDAIGQATSITYVSNTVGNPGYYKIAQLSDPFSRVATFAYDSATTTNLLTITDVIGLTSQFIYDTSTSFISAMTTPYGTTSFYQYTPPGAGFPARGLRFGFPDGTASVIENWINEDKTTYFWDREQTLRYPFDPANKVYTHCTTTRFLFNPAASSEAPVGNWVKPPLESRITYLTEGETGDNFVGTSNRPIRISRTLDDATTQIWNYQYNAFGHVTEAIDPIGRKFTYKYSANNVDLLEKRETKGTNNFLIGKWQYNNKHLPLVYIDGSGRRTQYQYNDYGELTILTDANNNTWTRTYNPNGYLTQIDGPLPGNNDVTTFSYDGYGRLYIVTDSEGYTLTYNYDLANRQTRVTYLDGTTEQTIYDKLDAILHKDRIGRWSQDAYDVMDRLAFQIDPLGRKTQYTWCACGALKTLTDPANQTTIWEHDLEGRITQKTYANQTATQYVYENSTSRLKSRTDALNQTTNYSYYIDNTLRQVSYTNAINPTSTVTYTYDQNYPRLSTIQNGWGTITYTYNPYITDPFAPPVTGGGRLQSVTNNVIPNSAITYTYDALGRTSNRSINGASNSITWSYDAMSRVTAESNTLGNFGYTYVDDRPGSSKGTLRLASINYPNSQVTNFSYYDNIRDQRLLGITNLSPNGSSLSQFNCAYNPEGEIIRWAQQQGSGTPIQYALGYDKAGQLTTAQGGFGSPPAPFANQYYYNYDAASNRTAVQTSTAETARIGGTVTAGDVLTITVHDTSLTGGQEDVSYTVQAGDTLTTIAANLTAAITANTNLQTVGVNAASNSTQITIKSVSPNVTSYGQSNSPGATETITLGVSNNAIGNAVIGGTVTAGDALTVTVHDAALTGGQEAVNYIVQTGDMPSIIAAQLAGAINNNTNLQAIGVSATSASQVTSVKSNSANVTTYTQSTSVGATETITLVMNMNATQTAMIGGTVTAGDNLAITVQDVGLAGGQEPISYTVQAGDTLTSIATGLRSAINANANLQAIGVSATSAANIINVDSNSINITSYLQSKNAGATETITLGLPMNGIQTATIGGTVTTSDVLTITVHDTGLSGGQQAVNYTVQSGDSLADIATGLATAINSNANLQAIGVTATSVATVININSNSVNLTTYSQSASPGATEEIALGISTSVSQYAYNNVNELTGISAGGATRFHGTTNKAIKSVTINTIPSTLNWSQNFTGNLELSPGDNTAAVQAIDGDNNQVTNNYRVSVKGASSKTLTYDLNGNLTNDGTNTYKWDAENRLIEIDYPGSGNSSQFTYDGLGRRVKIVEKTNNVITSTEQFIWCGDQLREERDVSGSLVSQYFSLGQTINGNSYFYTFDHLGSIRQMVNNSGSAQATYSYDPYGRVIKTNGNLDSDIQYARTRIHLRSGLYLTLYRLYNSNLGIWLSRDPVRTGDMSHFYSYCFGDPINNRDPLGLDPQIFIGWHAVHAGRDGPETGGYHGNIVVIDDDNVTVYRGDASGGFGFAHLGGFMTLRISGRKGGRAGYERDYPGLRVLQPVLPGPGLSTSDVATNLSIIGRSMGRRWPYNFAYFNSNSLIYSLLGVSGAIIPRPSVNAPGWGGGLPLGGPWGDWPPGGDDDGYYHPPRKFRPCAPGGSSGYGYV